MTQFNTIIIMLSMFKVLLLAACVAFVVGDDDFGGNINPCESAEAVACQEHGAMCLCMVPGGTPCSAEAVTACSDVAKGLECKKRDSAV